MAGFIPWNNNETISYGDPFANVSLMEKFQEKIYETL